MRRDDPSAPRADVGSPHGTSKAQLGSLVAALAQQHSGLSAAQGTVLAQVWLPSNAAGEGHTVLSTKGLPYCLHGDSDLMALFRCMSCRYQFTTSMADAASMGAVGRVFVSGRAEAAQQPDQLPKQVFLRASEATMCQLASIALLPLFGSAERQRPLGVLELVTSQLIGPETLRGRLQPGLEAAGLFVPEEAAFAEMQQHCMDMGLQDSLQAAAEAAASVQTSGSGLLGSLQSSGPAAPGIDATAAAAPLAAQMQGPAAVMELLRMQQDADAAQQESRQAAASLLQVAQMAAAQDGPRPSSSGEGSDVATAGPAGNALGAGGQALGAPPLFRSPSNTLRPTQNSSKGLTMEDLQAHFGVGLKEAAKRLGVCATTLKRACRRHGIKRWPRRQLMKLSKALDGVEQVQSATMGRTASAQKGSGSHSTNLGRLYQQQQAQAAAAANRADSDDDMGEDDDISERNHSATLTKIASVPLQHPLHARGPGSGQWDMISSWPGLTQTSNSLASVGSAAMDHDQLRRLLQQQQAAGSLDQQHLWQSLTAAQIGGLQHQLSASIVEGLGHHPQQAPPATNGRSTSVQLHPPSSRGFSLLHRPSAQAQERGAAAQRQQQPQPQGGSGSIPPSPTPSALGQRPSQPPLHNPFADFAGPRRAEADNGGGGGSLHSGALQAMISSGSYLQQVAEQRQLSAQSSSDGALQQQLSGSRPGMTFSPPLATVPASMPAPAQDLEATLTQLRQASAGMAPQQQQDAQVQLLMAVLGSGGNAGHGLDLHQAARALSQQQMVTSAALAAAGLQGLQQPSPLQQQQHSLPALASLPGQRRADMLAQGQHRGE